MSPFRSRAEMISFCSPSLWLEVDPGPPLKSLGQTSRYCTNHHAVVLWCVIMCTCIFVCRYICMFVRTYIYMCNFVCMCICTCKFVCSFMCMSVYTYMRICKFVCLHVCVYVCWHVYVCMCVPFYEYARARGLACTKRKRINVFLCFNIHYSKLPQKYIVVSLNRHKSRSLGAAKPKNANHLKILKWEL